MSTVNSTPKMATKNPDILIIGGGVIGLTIAERLAGQHLAVTLIDKGPIGAEASWASAGIIAPPNIHRSDPMAGAQLESTRFYPEFIADLHDRTGIDPQYIRSGALALLYEDQPYRMALSDVRATEGQNTPEGQPVIEILDPADARKLEPAIAEPPRGARLCRRTAQVRCPRLLQALQKTCTDRNVQIREHCSATALIIEGNRVLGVETHQGPIHAGKTVLCAGAWSSLIPGLPEGSAPTKPLKGQILQLRTPTPLITRIVERGKKYIVPRKDNVIIIGSTEEPEAEFDKRNTPAGIHQLAEAAIELVPALADAAIESTWSGLRPASPDHLPHIGPIPGLENLIISTAHERAGVTFAPINARITTDLILKNETTTNLTQCNPLRFTK